MKKLMLSVAAFATASTAAFSGTLTEPMVEEMVEDVETGGSSSSGILVPLLIVAAVAALIASSDDDDDDNSLTKRITR
ncbi:hypothetical protein GCM10007939_17390 [Amylibacter marinus]|uniref:Ferrochelatase n=1 Tax=Amylibacter marinus TaxID=1475483 RepID=A0ABQ5VWM5_9RHOB|nr:hypothetical protein [Amylibacter marinus]GLQ35456.1 hypothetical protein GCM10007939_17390 [Amylibacter marinus]